MNDSPTEARDWQPTWCVVEVMGHNQYAGLVTEQVVAGTAFIRVDVPEIGDQPAFSKLLGGGSIYAITPCSEAVAREAARRRRAAPLNMIDFSAQPAQQRLPEFLDPDEEEDWQR